MSVCKRATNRLAKIILKKGKRATFLFLVVTLLLTTVYPVALHFCDPKSDLFASGDVTSYHLPTAEGDTYSDATDPSNAYTDNGIYALMNDGTGNDQDYYDFEYTGTSLFDSITTGATIDGIEAVSYTHLRAHET